VTKTGVWRGDAKTLTAIQEHLLEVTPSAVLIEILGWNPQEEFYAFSNGIYTGGKFRPTDKLGVVADGSKHYFLFSSCVTQIEGDPVFDELV